MLLDMKARVEGIRALAVKLDACTTIASTRSRGKDDAKARLPPGPGRSARAAREGVRLRPGVPRLRDGDPDLRRRRLHAATTRSSSTAATRRSSRIYEGTNHIQAMDLVGRKLGQARRREPAGVPRRRRAVRRGEQGARRARPGGRRSSAARRRRSPAAAMQLLGWFQARQDGDGAARREPLPRDDERDHGRLAAARGARSSRSRRRRRLAARPPRPARSTRARSTRPSTGLITSSPASPRWRKSSAQPICSPVAIPNEAFATV